jgi:integrase
LSAITANVKTLVEAYYDGMVATKHKHPQQAKHYLDLIVAQFGNSTIRSVRRLELTTWLRTYSKGRPRAGDMMRSHLKKIFAYAVECGYIDNSPAEGITNNITGYIPKAKERVLTDDEIRFVFALKHQNAPLLRFLLLTGLRISEAQEGYLDGDRWRKDDTKNGKAHWVYLPPLAMQQLPLPDCTPTNIQAWIKRVLMNQGYQSEVRKEGYNAYTPHDLRRTFATRLNDAGVEPFVVEKCTNHTMEGVMAVYNRAEYEAQRIEAAHKMQAIIMQIIQP